MSSKQFFVERYEKLGWSFHHVKARQAIRINESNVKGKRVLNRLKQNGVTLDRIPFLDNGFWVRRSRVSVGATAEYLLGFYSIQEAAAQIPASLFSDLKGKVVLDACAAPGGKTVQLADLMENTGVIEALDVDKRRLSALANHLERCQVSNTVVYDRDARYSLGLKLMFDRILLDVPCSGNFVTDEHWFKRRTLRDVERNARLQREILTETCKCLKDEGEIIYSTCSLEPEEDELNVDWAIKNLDLKVEKIDSLGQEGMTDVFGRKLDSSISCCRRIWPGDTQG
ncbi:RsmB/NOP family class I SAM-dependent RNA methyltransferase, partial [Candidatus Bathyarchaeota archaeon]